MENLYRISLIRIFAINLVRGFLWKYMYITVETDNIQIQKLFLLINTNQYKTENFS
jgi:hypothetical protein